MRGDWFFGIGQPFREALSYFGIGHKSRAKLDSQFNEALSCCKLGNQFRSVLSFNRRSSLFQNRTANSVTLSYNRRGAETLTNNVLSLIIAVVGIGLLIFGIVKLYSLAASNEADNAKSSLEFLAGKIKALEPGESNEFFVQGFKGGENWYFLAWGKNEFPKPDKCFFESCLCVCRGSSSSDCQTNGFCEDIDFENVGTASYLYYMDSLDNPIIKRNVQLAENLLILNVTAQTGRLSVEYYSDDYKDGKIISVPDINVK